VFSFFKYSQIPEDGSDGVPNYSICPKICKKDVPVPMGPSGLYQRGAINLRIPQIGTDLDAF
ncbi:hypothetical protein AVEN_62294-1, partial [Araneus ventricosus]